MERVTGIGGVFFRTHDPDRVNQWYATHLGVDLAPESYDVPLVELRQERPAVD
ncbi:hypothetical protein OG470_28430 [Micromonospora sp. NBC_00389]|uniref:hypothetical protein n=1 Tax=Micromonospora sp. NBC_00389 TaxID=2903586 RepID=UPI002E1E084E